MTSIDNKLTAARELHINGDYDAARKAYHALLKREPKNSEILHALGILHAQTEDFSGAIDYFRRAVTFEPQNPILYLNLGNALKSQNEFKEAAAAFPACYYLKARLRLRVE